MSDPNPLFLSDLCVLCANQLANYVANPAFRL